MNHIFAENAWLGPGQFARRAVIEFDSAIRSVRILAESDSSPADPRPVQWLAPGFINAHCHLEYSWLADKLPRGQIPFGQWMHAIISSRADTAEDAVRQEAAMAAGAQALIAGGCTTVFDSTTDGRSAEHLSRAGVRHFLFHEVLGISRERAEPIWNNLMNRLRSADGSPTPPVIGHGINPHAPYSVGPWLRQQLLGDGVSQYPQAWHLAETPDEDALFRTRSGSIADFLNSVGMELPGSHGGQSPFEFLRAEGQIGRCEIAFHGNTLSREEARFFSGGRALVHCPSTHRWFDRGPTPLRQWLDDGVNLCLGTDSMASSDTLSMLEVVRMTLQDNPDLTTDDVLQMAFSNAARLDFIARTGLTGTITAGAPADFVAIARPFAFDGVPDPWRAMLVSPDTRIDQVWLAGETRLR